MWQYLSYSDSVFLTDLSFMEEWPRRSKTLERHDRASSHCRGPVARSKGLRDPAADLPIFFSPQEFSHSAPAFSTCPLLSKCTVGLQTIYHLFVLRPLWYSLPLVLMTPSLNFTPVKIWFPPDPPLIRLSEVKNVFDVIHSSLFHLSC